MADRGWFVDYDKDAHSSHPWQICLVADQHDTTLSLDIWFATEDRAETFIRDNLLNLPLLEEKPE